MHPAAAIPTAVDPHVFLIGRPPVSEYLGYLAAQTLEGRTADKGALMDAWRSANDHIQELEKAEAGYADDAVVAALPQELEVLGQERLANPVVQRTYALAPVEIGMVELDQLVVFQKHINLAFADELQQLIAGASDETGIMKIALPLEERYDPPTSYGQIADAAWVFKSLSNDLRVLGAEVLQPEQIVGSNASGMPAAVLAISVGYGINFLSALQIEGRLVLNNGSHRAYALRQAGYTHAPCLVQKVSRREELDVLVGNGHPLLADSDAFLKASRPPLFKDYFDERLQMQVHVPRTVRQLQLGFSLGAADLPV